MPPQTIVPAPPAEVSAIAREAPETRMEIQVATMAHISNLNEADTLWSIVNVAQAHTRTFITLAKLIIHLQELRPDIRFLYPYLNEQGVRTSSIQNATRAVRVWHTCVRSGVMDESQFDVLTLKECISINRSLGGGQHIRREAITLAIENAAREESGDLIDVEVDVEEVSKITVHSRGVKLTGPVMFEEWDSLVGKWGEFKDNWHFGLADLVFYGRAHFGHAQVADALEKHGYSRPDVTTADAIAVVPEAVRQGTTLTSGHFRAIAKAGPDLTEKQRAKWVATTQEKGLSTTEVKRSVAAGKVIRTDADNTGRNSGIHTIQGVAFMFQQWKTRLQKQGIVFTAMPREDRQELMRQLQEQHDLYEEVKASL